MKVESTRKDHKEKAQQLLSLILTNTQNISNDGSENDNSKPMTYRIGLSGPPGVGKSTFIERFGMHVLSQNHRLSVLVRDKFYVLLLLLSLLL